MTEEHTHFVEGRIKPIKAAGIHFCRCGFEYLEKNEKYREPKTAEGKQLAKAWACRSGDSDE